MYEKASCFQLGNIKGPFTAQRSSETQDVFNVGVYVAKVSGCFFVLFCMAFRKKKNYAYDTKGAPVVPSPKH